MQLIDKVSLMVLIYLMTSCEKEPSVDDGPYKLPDFNNSHEVVIKSNLEFPSGLANYTDIQRKGLKSSSGTKAEVEGVYIEGPLFVNTGTGGSLVPYIGPKISKYSANSLTSLDSLTSSSIAEIDLNKYLLDFDSPYCYALPDSMWRSTSLSLDELILRDGSMLTSSSSSDKIFITNSLGETVVYLQNSELERITDMILGTDNKVYAVQAPLIDENDSTLIIYSKKVISIDNGIINTEFELPSDVNTHSWDFGYWMDNWWKDAAIWEKLRIIENSENGKKQFGAEFYISDLLECKIYKIGRDKKVEVLAENLRFPTSLAVDSIGNIYFTTSPLSTKYHSLDFQTEIFALNPETGESNSIHTFSESAKDYHSVGGGVLVDYNSSNYFIPIGFSVTNVLYETEDKLEFLFSNSNQGTLKYVRIEK